MLLPTVPAMAKGRVARTTDDGPLLDKELAIFLRFEYKVWHSKNLSVLQSSCFSQLLKLENCVTVAPRFLRQPANALAYEKENVELECSVYGQPEPSLHWLKNGELLVETEYLQRTRPERECSSSSEGRDEYKTQISDLSPGSNYMVRVAAHTSGSLVGASIHEVRVFTKPDLDLPSASESESCLHLTHQSGGHLVAARTGQNAHHGIHHVLYAVFSSGWVSRRTRSKGHWYVT
ncbi:neogenin-like [Eriocheir sinensis]|uniref:neogenin-like n=1 Tax=Eriocheir sinensis TaxID=95602 RepID=UPI0021C8B8DB|nr:neogenin-like [Eriocheir sinensis]